MMSVSDTRLVCINHLINGYSAPAGCQFNNILIDGPRGSGKTYLCDAALNLCSSIGNAKYYKTWSYDQKNIRHKLNSIGLELPQGSFFVLDFLAQVELKFPLIIDRSFLSSLNYQASKFQPNVELHKYYVQLLRASKSCIFFLDTDRGVILSRRVNRGEIDEERLCAIPFVDASKLVDADCSSYQRGLTLLCEAGLKLKVQGPDYSVWA